MVLLLESVYGTATAKELTVAVELLKATVIFFAA